ncbi:MAG TPA: SufD family Fe-S cluster assembly protein [Candidatus Mediterraneibacter norfolkensis]|nr:SufD family Fe-S cluster assembly protein [Candidatus Mediterraneibacter norfolkensis]
MESNNKVELDKVTQDVLNVIDSYGFKQEGAYNLRLNGMAVCHGDSRHINIVKKEDKPGIDIHISGEAKDEMVHIPVVMSKEGVDIVYNDFYIEDGADVTIIAGCGIHGEGCSETRHDGIHAFHVGKGCNVKYIENHYAEGSGTGQKVLNPVTKIYVGEDSVFTLETTQIKGVDATERENYIELAENAKLFVTEKLMTDEGQSAVSNMDVELNGENSSARIVSRSVGKGNSKQVFHPKVIGNNRCHAHVQCDSIIMDGAEISSIPEIDARHVDAQIIHEAAIGRINDEQLIKLRTFGMTEEEAEAVIIESFLK